MNAVFCSIKSGMGSGWSPRSWTIAEAMAFAYRFRAW